MPQKITNEVSTPHQKTADTREVDVYRVVISVTDFERVGAEALVTQIENGRGPEFASVELLEKATDPVHWDDDHPLNGGDSSEYFANMQFTKIDTKGFNSDY